MTIEPAIQRLTYLLNIVPSKLEAIPEKEFSAVSGNGKWSKKQVLGHLIDSAANNHQRFVRVQFEDMPAIVYQQDDWNTCNYYAQVHQQHLIELWQVYNRHLCHILTHIPADKLGRKCVTNEPKPVTLAWLANDYVAHMEHHLHQLVEYW
jgi:hypothetical protein